MPTAFLHWLQRVPGFDGSRIPDDATVYLTWLYAPQSWGVFVLAAALLAGGYVVVWLYQRELPSCPRSVKLLLAVVRLAVLLMIVTIILGPALTYTQRRTERPWIVVLRDDSKSMTTADRYLDDAAAAAAARGTGRTISEVRESRPTRIELVDRVFRDGDPTWLTQLRERGRIKVLDFSDRVIEAATFRAAGPPSRQPGSDDGGTNEERPGDTTPVQARLPTLAGTGQRTDVTRALQQALTHRPTAAVVLITDGQHTQQDNVEDAVRATGQDVPVLVVGVGDPSRPRNLKVTDVYTDPQIWRDDPFEVQSLIRAEGNVASSVTVELLQQRLARDSQPVGQPQVISRRDVTVPAGGGQVRANFDHRVTESGRYAYTVRVEPVDDELSEDDNLFQPPVEVRVLSQQARVLLVAGAPSWDYMLLQRVLTRDNSINVSCWLQTMDVNRAQEGNTVISRLPDTRDELFRYDVVMLVDPNPRDFDESWIELLKQFCSEHAGGVLYMAGPKYSGRFLDDPQTRQMRDVLPVRLGDVGAMEVASLLAANTRAWPLGIVRKNVGRPIMRFYPEEERSARRWETLPGIFWSFPAEAAKPAARVLVEHSDPTLRRAEGSRPLLVTGQYGSGRTVYIGFNGSWRWRRVGPNAEFYRRFWIQTTRYLVEGRSLEGRRRGILESDRDTYDLGDRVRIMAQLKDATYRPLMQDEVQAIYQAGDGEPETVLLKSVPEQPGQFEVTLTAQQTGFHTVAVLLQDETSAAPAKISAQFAVRLPSAEMGEVWLNEPLLNRLADATGGAYYRIDQLDQLVAAVPDRVKTVLVPGKPILLWDALRWPLLLLLAGLLTLEWGVRKWFKLL